MKIKSCLIFAIIFFVFSVGAYSQDKKLEIKLSPNEINQAVLEEIARVLRTSPKELDINKTFRQQRQKADALDIVETIMSIEERLDIEISDDEIDKACGAKGVEDIAEKLTINTFQRIVRESYSKIHK